MSNMKPILVSAGCLAGLAMIVVLAVRPAETEGGVTVEAGSANANEARQSNTAAVSANNVPMDEREKAYLKAVEQAEEDPAFADWPESPAVLAQDFFQAASEKNFDRLMVLCPGATREDFVWYEQFPPSPAKAVGAPERHPIEPSVTLFPVKVAFPGFPNKTVKLAMREDESGRLVIDGKHTIWW